MSLNEHIPLSISRLTPNRIETATDKAISISWQDSRDENPYGQAEEFAAFLVKAANSHEALIEALRHARTFIAEQPSMVTARGDGVLDLIDAALSTAESGK